MNKLNRKLVLIAAAALLGLSGCASTGNRFVDDSMVTAKVKKAFFDDRALKVTDISVSTERNVVSLTGTVKTRAERTRAGEVARNVEGVRQVRNGLKVLQ